MNADAAPTKPWYQSRILWFNVCSVLLAFVELKSQALKGLLPASVYEWLLLLVPLGNMLLRMDTHAALTTRAPAAKQPGDTDR
jgi:hypothetical protein